MDIVSLALDFLGKIWSFIVALFDFLINIISSIDKVFNYIVTYIFELPTLLMTMFNYLPDFMQGGFLIIVVAIVFIFVIKIIKIFKEAFTK